MYSPRVTFHSDLFLARCLSELFTLQCNAALQTHFPMPLEGLAKKSHVLHVGEQVKSNMLFSFPPHLLVSWFGGSTLEKKECKQPPTY